MMPGGGGHTREAIDSFPANMSLRIPNIGIAKGHESMPTRGVFVCRG